EFAVADLAAVPDEGRVPGLRARMVAKVFVQGPFPLAPGGQAVGVRAGLHCRLGLHGSLLVVRSLLAARILARRRRYQPDVPASRPMVASSSPASRRTSAVCS